MKSRIVLTAVLTGVLTGATAWTGGAGSAVSPPATAHSALPHHSDHLVASERAAKRAPLRYAALGDSYSAASGVLPIDPTAPQCLRSTRNYPNVIASKVRVKLTDVTCGGADTHDYTHPQYQGTPPQLRALSRRTQLVTMTIGGNDSGVFINSILKCGVEGATTAGTGSPCKDRYGNSFERTVRHKTYPSLVKTLERVHAKAPRAKVAILGYLRILPPKRGCYPQMPVAKGDVPYLFSLQKTLNNVVRRAARKTGTTFVGVTGAARGHDACKSAGKRYVEPVVAGTNPVIVHPNARGERVLAKLAIRKLRLR